MQLVEKHIISKNHNHYKECDDIAFLSKNLYNKANYIIRQEFINNSNYLNYNAINRIMIDSNGNDYRMFPAKVANGILRILDTNWISYFKSIKDWAKHPTKYKGKPKLPKYKHKEDGRNILHYELQAVSKLQLIKNGLIHLSKTNIYIKSMVKYEDLQAVRIVPKYDHYVIEVIYNKEIENKNLNTENVLGIDLGMNNLASCASTTGDTFIINGKPIKSINQYYNKTKSKLQSKLEKNQYKSKRIGKLTNKRNNKIDNYLHKSSKYIIDYCLAFDIGKIVIGNNDDWKQKINLGKKTNQNFVSIPFEKFIKQIQYKAQLQSIEVVITEESYTSKCSFIDDEPMKHHNKYVGKRVKRGMFKSANDVLINADINGAFNIIRKVVPLFNFNKLKYGIEGVAVHPMRISFA